MAKYHQVAERILKNIATGSFRRGGRIPSEKDLAADLNLSIQTVNKAIAILVSNGYLVRRPGLGSYVAEEIDLEELKASKQFTVAIMVDTSVASLPHADHILGRIAFNLQSILTRENFTWTIVSKQDGMDFRDYLASVDGFITVGDVEEEFVAALTKKRIPCVTFNRDWTSRGLGSVLVDPETIDQMVEQMIAVGHRNFVYVTNEAGKQVYILRLAEYRAALEGRGLSCRHLVIPSAELASGALRPEARRFISGADFAFLPNDSLAIAFLNFLQCNGFQVPQDLSICGYDNSMAGRHCSVPLTTIAFDILEACNVLVRSLKKLLFEEPNGKPIMVDSWLILRESTARRPPARGAR